MILYYTPLGRNIKQYFEIFMSSENLSPQDIVKEYIESHQDEFQADLFDLLRIPTISSQSAHLSDMDTAVDWLCKRLETIDLKAEKLKLGGHPVVYAETKMPNPALPTILFYGHYDVQPTDPDELWDTPAFEPTVRDGDVYARGASDDKGQFLTHILGAQAWFKTTGSIPVNVKYLIEGDEECSAESLDAFVRANPDKLACDCVVISDSQMFGPGRPAIVYGLRGIVYFEVIYKGPNRDLHSGTYGGAITNPAVALCKAIAAVQDSRYKVTIPEFYSDVKPIESEEQQRLAGLGINDAEFLSAVGVSDSVGEQGYTLTERRWARPSFDVCGIKSGYTGEGGKTVLPSVASAKLSCRLVPRQDPVKILAAARQFFQNACPAGVTMEWIEHSYTPAMVLDVDNPYIIAAANTLEKAFGRSPEFIRDGGSIPIVISFSESLKKPVLLLGLGQNSDNIHSPNEHFSLTDFHRGIKASAMLIKQIASMKKQKS